MRQRRHLCAACRALISHEVWTTTRRLLSTLEPRRRLVLKEAFGGKVPKHLCAPCFNATLGTLNNVAVRQMREAA